MGFFSSQRSQKAAPVQQIESLNTRLEKARQIGEAETVITSQSGTQHEAKARTIGSDTSPAEEPEEANALEPIRAWRAWMREHKGASSQEVVAFLKKEVMATSNPAPR